MSLTVAPADGFDSLLSLADADAYHARMGAQSWALADAEKREAALRRATQYILARRVKPPYLNPVHANVAAATAEAALRALDGSLYSDVEAQSIRSESVGPITVSYGELRNGGRKSFPVIDDLLRGLASGSGLLEVLRA